MIKNLWIVIVVCAFISACSTTEINTEQELYSWINNVDNGFFQVEQQRNIKLSAKYLPPELLAIKDIKAGISNGDQYDSLVAFHQLSKAFLLQISSINEAENSNIMYSDLTGAEDYKNRVETLNYHLDKFISLKINNIIYSPVLHSFENTYGLANTKNLYVVFVPQDNDRSIWEGEKLELVFEDEIFNSGTNTFSFYKKDLDQLPAIKPALINSL